MISSLYDEFKRWSKTGSVWILSDLHFEDTDCKLMDSNWLEPQEQVDLINRYVGRTDTFVCLGDVGKVDWIRKIKAGYKVLITGNHDVGNSLYKEYFNEIYDGPLFISDRILLSHEPINFSNCLNIHGHDHGGTERENHINVAANICGYTPINLGQIIKEGYLKNIKSIHRETIDNATEKKYNLGKVKHPELYEDEEIERLVDLIYGRCPGICDQCEHHNEVEEDTCMSDVIMELWRKWRNLKEASHGND